MRLLQKTIRSYIVYSVFILLVAIPIFYLVIKGIVKEDTDEHLQATKVAIKPGIIRAISDQTITNLHFADQDIRLTRSRDPRPFESFHNQDIYDSVSQETVPYRILLANFTVDGQSWLLQIRNSMVDSDDLIASIVEIQALMLFLLLSGLLLINRSLSKSIWRPFYAALEKLHHYKVEQPGSLLLAKSSVHEFDDLNRSLEELTTRISQAYLTQKEFTENASHEMQTPLAIFQSKLELLMQTSPLQAEQAALIGDLDNASQRMRRLSKSLILLARIENFQFADKEPVFLATVIEKTMAQFQPQSAEKQINLEADLQEPILVEANRVLVEVLIGNLLSNAIRHNNPAGLVRVVLDKDRLIIQNTGKDTALDREQVFRRFHKESLDVNSIGLGLPIVQQIGHLYGWAIHYEYRDSRHIFTLLFS